MTAQFDKIAERFVKSRGMITNYVIPTFLDFAGSLERKAVLDLACGNGRFSRIMKQRGASEVLGIDISQKMIALARHAEKKKPLGIRYLIGDVAELPKLGEFDIATAILLLHYAKTEAELQCMCQNVHKNLKDGGTFIAILRNPKNTLYDLKKYGSVAHAKLPLKEGDTITIDLYSGKKKLCSFYNYHWERKTYDKALKRIGFKKIRWHVCKITDEGKKKFPGFWKDYSKNPGFAIITCTK